MQILVLGMHRSGTSLTTRLINMMGAYFGPEGIAVDTRPDNPKGYWERKDILRINQAIIAHRGDIPQEIQSDIKRLILGMDAFRPWVAKDPRFCLTLPHWLPQLEVPVAVIVYRHPLEIARSLLSREGKPIDQGLVMWEQYATNLIRAAQDIPKIFTIHAAMMRAPATTVRTLYNDLIKNGIQGLRLPSDREILAFLDPTLHHEHAPETTPLTARQQHLCAILRGETPFRIL